MWFSPTRPGFESRQWKYIMFHNAWPRRLEHSSGTLSWNIILEHSGALHSGAVNHKVASIPNKPSAATGPATSRFLSCHYAKKVGRSAPPPIEHPEHILEQQSGGTCQCLLGRQTGSWVPTILQNPPYSADARVYARSIKFEHGYATVSADVRLVQGKCIRPGVVLFHPGTGQPRHEGHCDQHRKTVRSSFWMEHAYVS